MVPLYESGRKTEPQNYRPLTSVVYVNHVKVTEKYWTKFSEAQNSIRGKQFGFGKGRSCGTNLPSFGSRATDEIEERDGWVDCIYPDLEKAFDKSPLTRPLRKLENEGLKGNMIAVTSGDERQNRGGGYKSRMENCVGWSASRG